MNKIQERIRKLLTLARHPATPEDEALAAAAKARELMIEYEISPEAVDDVDRSGEFILHVVAVPSFSVWQGLVRQAAAKMYFCEMMLEVQHPDDARSILFFGAKRHMEAAVDFGIYLEEAVNRKVEPFKDRPPGFQSSFRLQAAATLAKRIEELIRKEKPSAMPGSNLPVPLDIQSKLDKALAEVMKTTESTVSATVDDALGLVLGRQAGKEIALNRQVGADKRAENFLPGK